MVTTSFRTAGGVKQRLRASLLVGPTPRVLKLYVGALAARGKLTAKLTTGDSSGSTVLDQPGGTLRSAVLTVAYQAPR